MPISFQNTNPSAETNRHGVFNQGSTVVLFGHEDGDSQAQEIKKNYVKWSNIFLSLSVTIMVILIGALSMMAYELVSHRLFGDPLYLKTNVASEFLLLIFSISIVIGTGIIYWQVKGKVD